VYWKLTFFDFLPNECANDYYKNQLLETFSNFTNHIGYLRFESVAKYLPIDEGIIHKALKIIVEKIEEQNLRITLSYDFFEIYSKNIPGNFKLLTKAYIQQEKISNLSDLERTGLKTLL